MEQLVIEGGHPLTGVMSPSGNKNAALPLLAATLLTRDPVTIHNVPEIRDVSDLMSLLSMIGVEVKKISEGSWQLQASELYDRDLNPELCKRIRASILLAGPMVSRIGKLSLPPPGGDVIGRRRVDTHILALRSLGVEVDYDQYSKTLNFSASRISGNNILLDEASVLATENTILASVISNGTTTIRNAASEPHVQELCIMLNTMGAKIRNIGSNTLEITGVKDLSGTEVQIGPDYLEVVSYIGAAVVTNGSITIKDAGVKYLDMISLVFNRLGVSWETKGEDIIVPQDQELSIKPDLGNAIPEIKVMPWPSFPTDLISIAIVVATQSKGSILFHDWMYPSRMFFIDKLVSMGAQIVLCDPHRCIVQGPSILFGEKMESPDIRAGMALVLASLAAKGKSLIRNVSQIDRGYERVDKKLRALGARIHRVSSN